MYKLDYQFAVGRILPGEDSRENKGAGNDTCNPSMKEAGAGESETGLGW